MHNPYFSAAYESGRTARRAGKARIVPIAYQHEAPQGSVDGWYAGYDDEERTLRTGTEHDRPNPGPAHRVRYDQRGALSDEWMPQECSRNKDGSRPMSRESAEDLVRHLEASNTDPDSLYQGRIRNIRIESL